MEKAHCKGPGVTCRGVGERSGHAVGGEAETGRCEQRKVRLWAQARRGWDGERPRRGLWGCPRLQVYFAAEAKSLLPQAGRRGQLSAACSWRQEVLVTERGGARLWGVGRSEGSSRLSGQKPGRGERSRLEPCAERGHQECPSPLFHTATQRCHKNHPREGRFGGFRLERSQCTHSPW